jgi:hypothetical protein
MKTVLYFNTIASMALMLIALWFYGHRTITEIQFIVTVLFCVFTGVLSLYGALTSETDY